MKLSEGESCTVVKRNCGYFGFVSCYFDYAASDGLLQMHKRLTLLVQVQCMNV